MKPKIIVLTPVRNEAWILPAYLEATSLWADYIIVADQMSTDGSRDIYQKYPKVRVVNNDKEDICMSQTRQLLFDTAKQVIADSGYKQEDFMLFALDADEFLSGDFQNSSGWKLMMNSKPDDGFSWRWKNLSAENASCYALCNEYYYWAIHVSENIWSGFYPDRFIHEWRLPWSNATAKDKEILLDDVYLLHFSFVNRKRENNKRRFYEVSTIAMDPHASVVAIYRLYHRDSPKTIPLEAGAYEYYINKGVDIWSLIDFTDEGNYYNEKIQYYLQNNWNNKYKMLDVWDSEWCERHKVRIEVGVLHKLVMFYLKISNPYCHSFPIRVIDKLLKKLGL